MKLCKSHFEVELPFADAAGHMPTHAAGVQIVFHLTGSKLCTLDFGDD